MININNEKSSIFIIILFFCVVISGIFVCFTFGKIEHKSKNDKIDNYVEEKDKNDDIIDSGDIIVIQPRPTDNIINKENTVSKNDINKKEKNNTTSIVSNKSEGKTSNTTGSTNFVETENKSVPTKTPEITSTPKPTSTIVPTPSTTPTINPTINPTPSITPTIIPSSTPDLTPFPTLTPTPTSTPTPTPEPTPTPTPEIDRTGTYWVQDKKIVWEDNCKLGIFKNPRYNMKNIIAPSSTNTYVFYVNNKMGFDLNYVINFSEENDMNVNMMYKLMREDEYIAGDENTWVYYDSLHIDYNIENNGKDKYILEWKWIDSDNDTEIGINHAGEFYKLKVFIQATQIGEIEPEEPEDEEEEEEDEEENEVEVEENNNIE